MLPTINCKYCKRKFPTEWQYVNATDRACPACEIFGPQPKGPGYNLRIKEKEKPNEQR